MPFDSERWTPPDVSMGCFGVHHRAQAQWRNDDVSHMSFKTLKSRILPSESRVRIFLSLSVLILSEEGDWWNLKDYVQLDGIMPQMQSTLSVFEPVTEIII